MKQIAESDKNFAKGFENFVNGEMRSAKDTGCAMTEAHRYLVNEEFKVALAFIDKLADDYKNGRYDARNEYACKRAAAMIEKLEAEGLYYSFAHNY